MTRKTGKGEVKWRSRSWALVSGWPNMRCMAVYLLWIQNIFKLVISMGELFFDVNIAQVTAGSTETVSDRARLTQLVHIGMWSAPLWGKSDRSLILTWLWVPVPGAVIVTCINFRQLREKCSRAHLEALIQVKQGEKVKTGVRNQDKGAKKLKPDKNVKSLQ